MTSRRAPFAGIIALLLVLAPVRGAVPFPTSQWFGQPNLSWPRVSPDGKSLAALVRKTDRQHFLVEYDPANLRPKTLASIEDVNVRNIFWKGNDRLLLLVESDASHNGFWVYDFKTQKLVRLGFLNSPVLGLVDLLPADPDHILVISFFSRGYHLTKLNLTTGVWESSEPGKADVAHWFVDRSGNAIAALGLTKDKYFLLWRATPKEPWSRRELGPLNRPDLLVACVLPDQKRLAAWDYTGPNAARVVALDPATMSKETIYSPMADEAEEVETWGDDLTRPVAVVVEAEKPQCYFFDDDARQLQETMDAALPQTVNRVQSVSRDGRTVVVSSTSDRERGMYYLLDRGQHKLVRLGRQYPDFNPDLFGPSQPVAFPARDGTILHGRLTLPPSSAGKNPPPLVVIVGDEIAGPKDNYGFDIFAQIFATRGYAVLRLAYRGTAGYGRAFLDAGNGQIEKGMPGDLEDGVRWLGQKGSIDGSRVALCGRFLGGIVAMNALARSRVYSCWINWHTPTLIPKADEKTVLELGFFWGGEMSEAGGHQDGQDYRKAYAPEKLLRDIHVPSFHCYSKGPAAGDMEAMLKGNRADFVFLREKSSDEPDEYPAVIAPIIDQMLDFLDRHLGSARPAQ